MNKFSRILAAFFAFLVLLGCESKPLLDGDKTKKSVKDVDESKDQSEEEVVESEDIEKLSMETGDDESENEEVGSTSELGENLDIDGVPLYGTLDSGFCDYDYFEESNGIDYPISGGDPLLKAMMLVDNLDINGFFLGRSVAKIRTAMVNMVTNKRVKNQSLFEVERDNFLQEAEVLKVKDPMGLCNFIGNIAMDENSTVEHDPRVTKRNLEIAGSAIGTAAAIGGLAAGGVGGAVGTGVAAGINAGTAAINAGFQGGAAAVGAKASADVISGEINPLGFSVRDMIKNTMVYVSGVDMFSYGR